MKKLSTAMMTMLMCLVLTGSAMAYTILDDATGGDCTQIGTWDAGTKTCTLTGDLSYLDSTSCMTYYGPMRCVVNIESDYISLNGSGHIITGNYEGDTYGIYVYGKTNVTISNVNVNNFVPGVHFWNSINSNIANSTTSNNYYGIIVVRGNHNSITNNISSSNIWDGIMVTESLNNILSGNVLQNNYFGVRFGATSGENSLTGNTLSNNVIGIRLENSSNNTIYQNNFIDNNTQIEFYNIWQPNIFNLESPIGGNYWSNYDSVGEGCSNTNNDGLCDLPYIFYGGVDNLPWVMQNGWVDTDGDGYVKAVDCNDNNATIYPGATEIKLDGIDQDCNGYDLTINIVTANYRTSNDQLLVEATSSLGASANLTLVNYGSMTWKAAQSKWSITVKPAGGNPGTVTVSGTEGSTSTTVTVQ